MRRRGAYAPLSATYAADDAIMEAGEAAELLFVRALAFCSSSDSDGFITRAQLVRWVGAGMLDAEDRAKRLVEVGLWVEEGGGYQIRSWLDWNEGAEEKGRKKRQDRERKAAERSAVRVDTDPDTDPEPPPDPPGESERSPSGQGDGVRAESGRTGSSSPCLDTEQHTTDTEQNNTGQGQRRGRAARREPDRFDEFWLAYPRKVDKGHARTAWAQMRAKGHDQEVMIAGAVTFGQLCHGQDPKYIPHAATWLRGERWNDEPDPRPARPAYWQERAHA